MKPKNLNIKLKHLNMKLKHLLIAVVVLAAVHAKASVYDVSGTWEGGNGKYVIIQLKEGNIAIDSTMVVDGKFRMSAPFQGVKEVVFKAGGGSRSFLLEEAPVLVTCTSIEREGREPRVDVVLTGSLDQDIYAMHQSVKMAEMIMTLGLAFASEDRKDTITQVYLAILARSQHVFDSLITNYPDHMASTLIIIDQGNDWGLEKTETMFNKLTPRIQETANGQRIKSMIELMKSLVAGAIAPDFTLTDKNGNQVSISDFRGKYLILDFWGSWCGPCIRTHPKMVEKYNKYRGDSFEILGLASERVNDNVAWLAAIEKGGLEWPQANLKTNANGQELLNAFNVRNFPTKILLNPEGKIAGTWIGRLDEMYEMLEEIFGM
jgi:thiol-disulfide isomerase/thioredoxin